MEKGGEVPALRPLDGMLSRYGLFDAARRETRETKDSETVSETRERQKETSKARSDQEKTAAPKESQENKEKKPEAKPPLPFRPAFQFRGGGKSAAGKQASGSSAAERAATVKKISEQFQMSAGKFATQGVGEPKIPPPPGSLSGARETAEKEANPVRPAERSEAKESDKTGERVQVDRPGPTPRKPDGPAETQEKEDWTGIRRSSTFQAAKTEQEQRQQVARRESPSAAPEGKSASGPGVTREEQAPQPSQSARREAPPSAPQAQPTPERQESKQASSHAPAPNREGEQTSQPQPSQRQAPPNAQQTQPPQASPPASPERPDKPAAPTREGEGSGGQQQQQQQGQRREQPAPQSPTQAGPERDTRSHSGLGSGGREHDRGEPQPQNPRKEQAQGQENFWQPREEGQRERGDQGQRRRQPQTQRAGEKDEADGAES